MRLNSFLALFAIALCVSLGCGQSSTAKHPKDASTNDGTGSTPEVGGGDANTDAVTKDDAPKDVAVSEVGATDATDATVVEAAPEVPVDPCAMCGANSTCTARPPATDGGTDTADGASEAGADAADGGASETGADVADGVGDGAASEAGDGASGDGAAPAGPCVCNPGYAGDGITCVAVATSLSGLRWNLPCTGDLSSSVCSAAPTTQMTMLAGQTGTTYAVKLRFRGVIEQKSYTGGTADGYWLVGGTPASDGYNVYQLQVSSPAQTFYLNDGASNISHCFTIDYEETIDIAANATLTLSADTIDAEEIKNIDSGGTPLVVPGIDPAPAAYNGQFVQMDVVSVVVK